MEKMKRNETEGGVVTDLLEGLNSAQREAVTSTEGFIRVIAGAGAGKTRALTHRFAYLVTELGILPGNILCVTFTNKAAAEMRQRIHNLTGDDDTGHICTFHSFCVTVLQEDINAVQYPKSFLVLDNSDINEMLRIIYEERGLTSRDMTFANARDMIEILKLFERPDYYLDMIEMSIDQLRDKYLAAVTPKDIIFYGYLYQEKKCFALDYNDLLKFTLYIFEKNASIRLKWQSRLAYIMIDEFQDIDSIQYELMEVLAGCHKNLFVIGDPDQVIYTWRGADVKYLLEFDKKFPGARTILMTENYRSTPEILASANSLIAKNVFRVKKDLIPTLPSGPRVVCHQAKTSQAEAAYIASEIERLHDAGVPYRDVTVLYRSHFVTRAIEEVFEKAKLPYSIYSGIRFFDRKEIKDALSYLRLIAYRDDLSFTRVANVPKRNLGQRRMEYLREYAVEHGRSLYDALIKCADDDIFKGTKARQLISLVETYGSSYAGRPVSEVLSAILNDSGYEKLLRTEGAQERLDNLAELKQSVYDFEVSCGEECTLEYYLAHVALFTNQDASDGGDKVKLMTVHAAKGLEFPYVFLCAMNEGVFPSKKTNTRPKMEEERRLAFVAMTRAEKALTLTGAQGRNLDGTPRYPSRFVLDIDPALLDFTEPPRDGLIREARAYIAASDARLPGEEAKSAFAVGDRVRHPVFGEGSVEGVDPGPGAYLIKFDGIATPRAISFRAKLEKV